MKIMVCAKQVVDANVKVRIKVDHSNVDTAHSKMSLNPFDENAIEAAVRLKEQGHVTEIIAVSIGGNKCEEVLRSALARGCDKAFLIMIDPTAINLESIDIAQILAKIVIREIPDLIIMGKQAIDSDNAQVGAMLAGILNYPQAIAISKLELKNKTELTVSCESQGGIDTLQITTPCVLTCDLHLNTPRFIKLPDLMRAKKATILKVTLTEIGIELKSRQQLIKVEDGVHKKNCRFLANTQELITVITENRIALCEF